MHMFVVAFFSTVHTLNFKKMLLFKDFKKKNFICDNFDFV